MRIWIGEEMEWQNKGLNTMFVETSDLSEAKLRLVLCLLSEQEDLEAIYFGAGRKDVKGINYERFADVLEYCWQSGLKITVETSNLNNLLSNSFFVDIIKKYKILIIIRSDLNVSTGMLNDISDQLVYKLDNDAVALFTRFEAQTITDITTVNKGLYDHVDTLIYPENQGGAK